MDVLYIVMPAYNEEENIQDVILSWLPVLEGKDRKSKLVVADSGSLDATHDILLRLKAEYPQIDILSDTEKYHGPKVIALYDYSIKNGADYIFQTDSDGQTNPKEFSEFWEERENYDGIFGKRTVRGDGKVRAFVEKVVCFLLRLYFQIKVPDANAPFRLMKSEIVKKYLYRMPFDYELPNIMMVTYFVYEKEKTLFKEISFQSRQGGKNSIHLLTIIKIGWNCLKYFYITKKKMRKTQ